MADPVIETPRRIVVLPPEVAARIAAGEVIERPASVVKELIENAIDAGARHIEVLIEGGGADRIRVHDDGHGIPPDQVADAFERHATSKLRTEHDLFQVRTLGFRGEALAAIAAAADVLLTTRTAEGSAAATLRYRGGQAAGAGGVAAAPGTTVDVRDLFTALPARRRFLRSAASETRAVVRVVTDAALARPGIAIRLISEQRTLLAAPGTGSAREALAAIYGDSTAGALLAAEAERLDSESDLRAVVTGLVSPPALHRGNRQAMHLVVNGRPVTSRSLLYGIEQAYAGLLPAGRHPLALLRIEVPPDQVDVNVHPQKAEVRFREERLVYAAVSAAVLQALRGAPVVPVPPLTSPTGPAEPGGTWESASGFTGWLPAGGDHGVSFPATGRDVIAGARAVSWLDTPTVGRAPSSPIKQAPLPLRERLPVLRAVGQFDATYLLAEGPDGLYLVDQHAAHERVLYERLQAARHAGDAASQPLLQAVAVALSPAQVALAIEQAETLERVGFEFSETDGAAVLLRAVPGALRAQDPGRALSDYLDRLEAEERLSGPERAIATLACRAAVMAGDHIDPAQQRELLRALEACQAPQTCPHGRPTMIHLSREALERSFGRR